MHMRKLLENWITAVVALATLVLSVIWFLKNKEIEPLIGIIASLGVLVTALVARFYPEKKETTFPAPELPTALVTIEKNTVTGSTITAGGDVHIGDKADDHSTGKTIVNNDGATIENQFNGGTFNHTTFN